MQQPPDKSSPALEPSDNNRHPAAGIGQLKSVPHSDDSETQLQDKYPWMAYVANRPIEYDIFDVRAQNVLKRNNCLTWGHLGTLTDEDLFQMVNIGDLTVGRINKALKDQLPTTLHYSAIDDTFLHMDDETVTLPPDPKTHVAIEWARVSTDDDTLGGLLQAHQRGTNIPLDVAKAIEIILATPLPRLSGHHVPLLGDLIDELIAETGDPELFVARECVRQRPTLEELGDSRNLTRERIRQIVARDVSIPPLAGHLD